MLNRYVVNGVMISGHLESHNMNQTCVFAANESGDEKISEKKSENQTFGKHMPSHERGGSGPKIIPLCIEIDFES